MSTEITPDLVSEVAKRLFQRDIFPLTSTGHLTGAADFIPAGPPNLSVPEIPLAQLAPAGIDPRQQPGNLAPSFSNAFARSPLGSFSTPTSASSIPMTHAFPSDPSALSLKIPSTPTSTGTTPTEVAQNAPAVTPDRLTFSGLGPTVSGHKAASAGESNARDHAAGHGTPVQSGLLSALMHGQPDSSILSRSLQNRGDSGFSASKPFGTVAPETTQLDGLRQFIASVRLGHVDTYSEFQEHDSTLTKVRAALSSGRTAYESRAFDIAAIRRDFPILNQNVHGRPLAWFDNAATTQKPRAVIDAISRFYERDNSNIHRGAHSLAARATEAFESARGKVQRFIGAGSATEIVFVRGTTEGINLVARILAPVCLTAGDEIVLTTLEHHANIVPWQMVARETGAKLRVAPVNDAGEVIQSEYAALLGPRTRLVALTHASNSLGTVLPITEMTQMAKRFGARVVIDGAQSVSHIPINVQEIGCDFFIFSGHKLFGPTGIGAVYIAPELHEFLPPWQGGGNMIRNVTFEETTFQDAPARFEAGTPNIADAVGLGAAIDYVSQIGLPNIGRYEHELLIHATEELKRIDGLRILGTAKNKVSLVSFTLAGHSPEHVGKHLDREGIAVRAGHHCAQPSLRRFGEEATVRPSFAFYNTHEEIDRLIDAIRRIRKV